MRTWEELRKSLWRRHNFPVERLAIGLIRTNNT